MTFRIREPRASDAAAIAELHVATWREAYGHLLPEDFFSAEHRAERHRMWQHVLANPRDDVTIRLAEIGEAIVGFSWAGPSIGAEVQDPAQGPGQDLPRARQLYAIYVAAAHHGSGIGQALLDAALGDGPAMLWVAKENPRATAFYVRNGFRLDGVEQTDPRAPLITDARMVR